MLLKGIFGIVLIFIISGCIQSAPIGSQTINDYTINNTSFSPFEFNVSGQPGINNTTTLICSANVSCIQDTNAKTITIDTSDEIVTENYTITHKNTYINASSIVSSGLTETAGNSVYQLNLFNAGYWSASENLSTPYSIIIEFHNVTHFDTIEAVHKYNSSGVPSSHIISRYIWCTEYNDWIELEEFSTENNFYYISIRFSDDDHFILANGTVRIKYEHPSNGNTAHRIFLDLCRLVKYENEILG